MNDEELLDALVGTWRITGTMRETPLAQNAVATRVLRGRFVRIDVSDGTPLIDGAPYEAVYFIGAAEPGRFVMTLLDTFGAAYSPVPGFGHRDGDGMVFEFAYAAGPWTWRWALRDGVWMQQQTYLENGEPRLFATKRMERA